MSLRAKQRDQEQEDREEEAEQVTKLPPPPLVTVGPLTDGSEDETRPREQPDRERKEESP